MALTDRIDGEKYDMFIGRAFYSDGSQHYVSIGLPGGGGSTFTPDERCFPSLVNEILYGVNDKRKMLMSQSPGFEEKKDGSYIFYVPFPPEVQQALENLAQQNKGQTDFLM